MSKMVIFEEFADLRLEVGEHSTCYMVCSKAMARSSPAFRGMLYGGFIESKRTAGDWVVRLPDEDPEAFAIILNIVHGRSDKVPMNLKDHKSDAGCPATLLYHLATIADKYCLLQLLRPWVNPWLNPWRTDGEWAGDGWAGEIVTAAWIFGDTSILTDQLDKLVCCARFRGMAYKGRAWVRDARDREWRLGGLPDGPNEILDIQGFSGMS
jgi:hypothetical protein